MIKGYGVSPSNLSDQTHLQSIIPDKIYCSLTAKSLMSWLRLSTNRWWTPLKRLVYLDFIPFTRRQQIYSQTGHLSQCILAVIH